MIVLMVVSVFNMFSQEDKLTEEQMTAYRTRPAVALIYSGLYINVVVGNGQPQKLPYYGSGSGFFINPDGYLVTNGHVVDIYMKYMADKDGYAQKVFTEMLMTQLAQKFKEKNGRDPNQEELINDYNEFAKAQQPRVLEHGAINYVILSNSENYNFEVKKFSPSIPDGGKDIAVLKIERDNCPVVMLGDSSQLILQQAIFTIGFPAVVDPSRFPLLGQANTLRSSITRGSISALKTDYKGMAVIQHDSATSPGNSGGPTVDIHGRVIGVHSYAATGADGFKFCVPINTAKEFIRETGIDFNKSSEFTTVFNKLMDSVWDGRWFDAQTEVSTALAYMKNEPDLEKIQQMVLQKLSGMSFFEKIWRQNKLFVIIAVVLVILILVVLKISFTSGSKEVAPVAPAPVVRESERPVIQPADKTKMIKELDGTVMEGTIFGTFSVFVKGEEVGTYNITSSPIIIGRDPVSATVVIKNEIVSKTHLKIMPKGDQFMVVDLGSTNGTYIDGEKISEAAVKPNDVIQIGKRGEVKVRFNK